MVDRFEELRTYVAIVEAGGVNAAAARIGIARSAVSRRLSELETRVGATLVERSTRKFELTEIGRALFDDSKRVLHELAKLDDRFAGATTGSERISVALSPDVVGVVATALASFHASRQEMTVDILASDDAAAGEADVRVFVGDASAGRPVGELQLVVVCSPRWLEGRIVPETLADLETHSAISVRGSRGEWSFRRGASSRPVSAFEVADSEAALALAKAGAGIAHLPRHLCLDAIERGTLTVLLSDYDPKPTTVLAEASSGSTLAAALVDALAMGRG